MDNVELLNIMNSWKPANLDLILEELTRNDKIEGTRWDAKLNWHVHARATDYERHEVMA